MTGTIRTLRTDKGFGFIKDAGGKDYFFHQSAVQGGGINDFGRATRSSLRSATGQRGLAPKSCVGRLRRTSAERGFSHRWTPPGDRISGWR